MKVNVASKNPVKVSAVSEIIGEYPMFSGAEVISLDVASDVADQPKSLDETVQGAVNRARKAFNECSYSFGMESGLMAVPHTKTGKMAVTACAIFDGSEFSLGLSSALEFPKEIIRIIHEKGMESSEAFRESGFTGSKNSKHADGIVGLLTKGRINRKEYTKQAIRMALISLENPEIYKK